LSSSYGKEHIEGKNAFGRILGSESYLTRFTNWVSRLLTWCLDHYFKTIAVVLVLFFGSTIGLLGGGSLVENSFAASDSGEF
jgi:HAE1 family hydrophobic/amphiphilic exporter-1